MAAHNNTGTIGENLAVAWLCEKEYTILERNWRFSHWEVDVIAIKENILHFIEVKTKRTRNFGLPEDNVNKKKIQNLINASEEYLFQNPQWKRIQFNVLAITVFKNEPIEYFLIEDVYI